MVLEKSFEKWFRRFSSDALKNISGILKSYSPGSVPDFLTDTLAIFLCSPDPFHLLIASDRDSPVDAMLAGIDDLLPGFSSFDPGESTGKVGLKQALSQADESSILITSLGEMKEDEIGLLFEAMEHSLIPGIPSKGQEVPEGKRSQRLRKIKCRTSIVARLIPSVPTRFIKAKEQVLEQLPQPELMAGAFNFPAIIGQKPKHEEPAASPSSPGLKRVYGSAKSPDIIFAREYIGYCRSREPYFPESLEDAMSAFFLKLKEREPESFFPINEKTLVGMLRLSKALARLELKNEVRQEHLDTAYSLFEQALLGKPK